MQLHANESCRSGLCMSDARTSRSGGDNRRRDEPTAPAAAAWHGQPRRASANFSRKKPLPAAVADALLYSSACWPDASSVHGCANFGHRQGEEGYTYGVGIRELSEASLLYHNNINLWATLLVRNNSVHFL